jgi:hypothetical protein
MAAPPFQLCREKYATTCRTDRDRPDDLASFSSGSDMALKPSFFCAAATRVVCGVVDGEGLTRSSAGKHEHVSAATKPSPPEGTHLFVARLVPQSGTRICCAEKIIGLLDVLDATKRLAVTSSPIENSATSDAHAN